MRIKRKQEILEYEYDNERDQSNQEKIMVLEGYKILNSKKEPFATTYAQVIEYSSESENLKLGAEYRLETSIIELDLGVRTYNIFNMKGIKTVKDIVDIGLGIKEYAQLNDLEFEILKDLMWRIGFELQEK